MAAVAACRGQLGQCREQRLQLLIVVGVLRVQVGVAGGIHLVHAQRQTGDVAQPCQTDGLLALRNRDAFWHFGMVRGGHELALPVAQVVHAGPGSPALQCLVDIVPLLLGRGIGVGLHEVVAAQSQLAALHQVLIFADDRVQPLQVATVGVGLQLAGLLLDEQAVGGQQGCAAVAGLYVVVAQHVVALGLVADEAQQVVAEVVAVLAPEHEGVVVGGLHRGQFGGVGQGLGVVFASYFLVAVFVQPAVVLVDVAQHAVVDGLQGHVGAGRRLGSLQAFHHGRQRVGRHLAQRTGFLQLRLQQLAVGVFLFGFRCNLAQHLLLRLRQVFFLGVAHLFPQAGIGL